jgi:hypothetical protein
MIELGVMRWFTHVSVWHFARTIVLVVCTHAFEDEMKRPLVLRAVAL